jgi:hypothetical protein
LVAYANNSNSFQDPTYIYDNLGASDSAGGWNKQEHVRTVADLNGDNIKDLIGFGNPGVFAVYGGNYDSLNPVHPEFGHDNGWNNVEHTRTVADVNNDGFADLVGFGYVGTQVVYNGQQSFSSEYTNCDFGYNQGWRKDKHVRRISDLNNNGTPSIVGFGYGGVRIGKMD